MVTGHKHVIEIYCFADVFKSNSPQYNMKMRGLPRCETN